MKSNVHIADHPMHPMLVLIPTGSWIASFVLDIVFISTDNTFWFVAAMWVMSLGIASAIIAALAGIYDLFTLPITEQPRKMGIEHMILNVIIVVLYLINVFAIRLPAMTSLTSARSVSTSMAGWGFGLNLVAVLLLFVSGWLGGELIYKFGVAVPNGTMQNAYRYELQPGRGRSDLAGSLGGESGEEE